MGMAPDFSDLRQHPEYPSDGAWQMLESLLPTRDLTGEALAGRLSPDAPDSPRWQYDVMRDRLMRIAKALYRHKKRNVAVTGNKGVGKSTLVQELAYQAARGAFPFLARKRFLWIDCTNLGPEDSRGCLETILTAIQGKDVVLCINGLEHLLVRPMGGSNKPLLRAAAARPQLQLVSTMSDWAFNDHLGGDVEMLEMFARVEVNEPPDEDVLAIGRVHRQRLQRIHRLEIPEPLIDRAIALTSTYVLSASQPAKSIRVLEQACQDADFCHTQLHGEDKIVSIADVVSVIAEETGIPAATITGESEQVDLNVALREAVVGQVEAVEDVAKELHMIKAGLTEPGKPATVLLFAGMTGVGKTELAKRVAELYSSSKRLQTYAMGNFTEPHTVSGIIGVPPGYVGHDQGGRLVNELNADPYSVFLLDEAEKAHPNVWKPFLNLFDEGWINDQRGVRAYADRAIFILTTNAGDNAIAQMTKQGKSNTEIADRVCQTLSKIRIERSSQPVFTPQFLSRIRRIVVFRALDQEAMHGITKKMIRRTTAQWGDKREKSLEVSEDLIQHIGEHCHHCNEQSGGKQGGRIVRKTISDIVESRIQAAAIADPEGYRKASRIIVHRPTCDSPLNALQVSVAFS